MAGGVGVGVLLHCVVVDQVSVRVEQIVNPYKLHVPSPFLLQLFRDWDFFESVIIKDGLAIHSTV